MIESGIRAASVRDRIQDCKCQERGKGYGRQTDREFRQFLSVARGSVFEVETQLEICIRQNYLSVPDAKTALALCDEVGRMLTTLSRH